MGSRVRVEAPEQAPQRPGGTAVAGVKEALRSPKRATRVVAAARGKEAARAPRPATPVEVGGRRAPWAGSTKEEASVRRAIGAMRAAVLLPGVEEPPAAVAVVAVVGGEVGEQEIEDDDKD